MWLRFSQPSKPWTAATPSSCGSICCVRGIFAPFTPIWDTPRTSAALIGTTCGSRNNERKTLLGHRGQVTAVAITADGKTAVSGSLDKTVRLWNLEKGLERGVVPGLMPARVSA